MPVLGVDVGSTRVHVAVAHEGQASAVPALDGLSYLPSVIGHVHGRTMIGAPARAHFLVNPAEVLFSPARHLGGGAVKLGGQAHEPASLVAALLEQAMAAGLVCARGALDGVALSRAAWASPEARRALAEAAHRAGMHLVRTEVSTTLAAIVHLVERGGTGLMVFIDAGGWKVEATVVLLEPGQVRALGRSVDPTIGANWLDGRLVKAFVHQIALAHERRLLHDRLCYGLLREHCEAMRVELSTSPTVSLSLPFLRQVLGVPEAPVWHLDRELLDRLSVPLVEAVQVVCGEALEHAQVEASRIKEAFVHGGLAHMPAVREAVSAFFHLPVSSRGDLDGTVARGAALAAAASVGQLQLRILDDLNDQGRSVPAAGWGHPIPPYDTPTPEPIVTSSPPPRPPRPSSGEHLAHREPPPVPPPARGGHTSAAAHAAAIKPAPTAHAAAPDSATHPAAQAGAVPPPHPDRVRRSSAEEPRPPSPAPEHALPPPAVPLPSAPAAASVSPDRAFTAAEAAVPAATIEAAGPPAKSPEPTLSSEGTFQNPTDPASLAAIPLDRKLPLGPSLSLPVLLLAVGRRRAFSGQLRLKKGKQEACLAIVRGGAAGSSLDMEQLRRAFEWPDGTYRITGEAPSARLVATRQPMVKVVLHGIRSAMRLMDGRQVLDVLNPHLHQAPIVLESRGPLIPLLGLSPRELRFVEHTLDGATSTDEILRRGGIGRETAVQLLFVLHLFRALDWRSVGERAGETTADQLRQRARKLEKADHFEALGVHWSVSHAELQRALQHIEHEMQPGGKASQIDAEAAAQILMRARLAYQAVARESDRRAYLLAIHPDLDFEAIESVAEDQNQWYAYRGAAAATEESARLKNELAELVRLQHLPPKSAG